MPYPAASSSPTPTPDERIDFRSAPSPSNYPVRGPLTDGNCHFDPSKKWDVDAAQLGVTGAQFYGGRESWVVGSAPDEGNDRALRFQGVFGQDGEFSFGYYDDFGFFRNSAPEYLERFCDFRSFNCPAERSYAFAVDSEGETTGMSFDSTPGTNKFLPVHWTPGNNILLPLENPAPASWGAAVDINSAGTITGIVDGKAVMWNASTDQPLSAFASNQNFTTIYTAPTVDPTGIFNESGPHPRFPINTGSGVFPTIAATTGFTGGSVQAAYAFVRQGSANFGAPELLPLPSGYARSLTESYALDVTEARYEKRSGPTILSAVYGQVVGYIRDRRLGASPEYVPVVWELRWTGSAKEWSAIPLVTQQTLSGANIVAVAGNSYGEIVGHLRTGSGWKAVLYTDTLGWSDLSAAVNPERISTGTLRRGVYLTEAGRVLASDGLSNAAYLLEPTYFHAVSLGTTIYEEMSEANAVSHFSERVWTGEEHPEVVGFGENLSGQKQAYVWYPDPYEYPETGLFTAEAIPVAGSNSRATSISNDGVVVGESGSTGFSNTYSSTSTLSSFANVHSIGPDGITVGLLNPLLGVAQRLNNGVPVGGPTRLIASGFSKTSGWGVSLFGANDYLIVGTRESGSVKEATTWTVNGSLTSAPIPSGPKLPGVDSQFDQTVAYSVANNGDQQAWIVGQALDTVANAAPALPEFDGKNVGVLWHKDSGATQASLLALRGINSQGAYTVSDDTVLRSVNEEGFAVGWATRLEGLITTKRDASNPTGVQRVGVLVSAAGSCNVPGLKIHSLEQAISPTSGWLIEEARSINENSLIAGIGRTADNHTTALLLVPPVRNSWACEPCPAVPDIAGDFNGDGCVDTEDYNLWRSDFGSTDSPADGNGDGIVNGADYTVWRDHLGAGCATAEAWADSDGDADVDAADLQTVQSNYGTTTTDGLNAGDYNQDGAVNGADFLAWQRGFGTEPPTTETELAAIQTNFGAETTDGHAAGDLDENGTVDGHDFMVWQRNFKQAPQQPQQAQSQRQAQALALQSANGTRYGNFLKRNARRPAYAPSPRASFRNYRRRLPTSYRPEVR